MQHARLILLLLENILQPPKPGMYFNESFIFSVIITHVNIISCVCCLVISFTEEPLQKLVQQVAVMDQEFEAFGTQLTHFGRQIDAAVVMVTNKIPEMTERGTHASAEERGTHASAERGPQEQVEKLSILKERLHRIKQELVISS